MRITIFGIDLVGVMSRTAPSLVCKYVDLKGTAISSEYV